MTTREIQLVRRPSGLPEADDFVLAEVAVPEPAPGQAVVENVLMSVDPYIRLHLDGPQPLGGRLIGGGVGRVVASRAEGLAEGLLVRHRQGFAERFTADASALTPLDADPELPLEAYLSVLGGIGLCAYSGLLGAGEMKPGEEVFVSAAAGAVGSLAVQVAKLKGCRVVGSTGSEDKAAWLRDDLGVDAVVNYRSGDLLEQLTAATPGGIDVYFENVGGAHLEAALARLNMRGRIAVCGMISTYNDGGAPVRGLEQMVIKRLTMRGFGFTDYPELDASFYAEMIGWLKSGQLKRRETVMQGLEQAPEALRGLFTGLNAGKMLLRL